MSQPFYKTFISTFLISLLLIAAFLGGYLVRDRQVAGNDLPILVEALGLLLKHGYNDPPTGSILEYGMIRGMLQAYGDPYTSFSEPAQHELTSNNLEGKFGGIGVQLQEDAEGFPILLPIPDSPAALAGILEGDRLVQVDDLVITPETPIETVQAAARGKVGSRVRISVERPPGGERLDFEIVRAEFTLPSVTSYLAPDEPRLGVVKVNVMAATTPEEITQAVQDLRQRGAQVFALDLRDNFGGLLTSGVDTARLFLKQGLVMTEQYRGQEAKNFSVEKAGDLADIPLVVLVNQNTASAAEITAGALQVQLRAKLIGTHTYGKDTVQLVFELRDKSSLQVTAAHWWVPDQAEAKPPSLAGIGLQPDIPLTEAPPDPAGGPDLALQSAIQYLLSGD